VIDNTMIGRRQLPVTEIREKNDSYKIKLGFKKQKFTELVKV